MAGLRIAFVCVALAACGGTTKKPATTTTGKTAGGADAASMADGSDPSVTSGTTTTGGAATPGTTGAGGAAAGQPVSEAPIVFPNHDPDPVAAKAQVDQQLAVARQALSRQPADADGALAAARAALKIDASSVDAAAYVALAYYHKRQLDTAELVLDDVFKRPSAKQNATVYYVYGLIYDHTNRPDQALIAYRKAVELDPKHASAHINLGVHMLRNKQYAPAQHTFEKVTRELGRNDAVTLTALGSAYRGRSSDYPPGAAEHDQMIHAAEAAYKRALAVNASYGPAYFNLAMLYLDADPFPSGGGSLDTLQRLNAAKTFLDQYKNAPGVDIKLYDERMKDIQKAIKREEKRRSKAKKGAG